MATNVNNLVNNVTTTAWTLVCIRHWIILPVFLITALIALLTIMFWPLFSLRGYLVGTKSHNTSLALLQSLGFVMFGYAIFALLEFFLIKDNFWGLLKSHTDAEYVLRAIFNPQTSIGRTLRNFSNLQSDASNSAWWGVDVAVLADFFANSVFMLALFFPTIPWIFMAALDTMLSLFILSILATMLGLITALIRACRSRARKTRIDEEKVRVIEMQAGREWVPVDA